MGKPVERRKGERAEDAEVWSDEERKNLTKLGGLFDKWSKRGGTPKEPAGKKKEKSFLEEIGISL